MDNLREALVQACSNGTSEENKTGDGVIPLSPVRNIMSASSVCDFRVDIFATLATLATVSPTFLPFFGRRKHIPATTDGSTYNDETTPTMIAL